ncbi:MAG: exodeoxyribonuclease V subunit gamma [Buchnera aphidicola (Floraphis choui)]
MFTLYRSYSFSYLIEKACSIFINNPLSNPLTSEIFVTPNKEINHWIKIFITQKYSISSNIKFLKFNQLIWEILKYITPNSCPQLEFKKYNLIWKMMNIKDIKYLTSFISKSNSKIKLFEIISFISICFKEYLLYRPDWIKKWETSLELFNQEDILINKNKLLWITLIKYMHDKNQPIWNYSNLLFLLENKIRCKQFKINQLPSRIFIFGNDFLTPYNLIILKKISKFCSIHFFYVTPYQNEKKLLLNQVRFKKQTSNLIENNISYFLKATEHYKKFKQNVSNFKNDINYIFLWGQYGYEYTLLLNLLEKKEVNIFKKIKPTCLLHNIQHDIIKTNFDNNNKKHKKDKQILHNNDQSISIHACTTLKREIEVLHDNILNILNTNHDILFHDILVISHNIDSYTPFINSIFNSINLKHNIPFYIASNIYTNELTISKTIIKILNLPNNLLDNESIFNFLENPFILKKFDITEKEVIFLFKFIKKSELNFENNENKIKHQSLKDDKNNILTNVEQRIFLGKAINDINYTIWNQTVPYNTLSEEDYEIFSKFTKLTLLLRKWKKKLSISKSLVSWNTIFKKLLSDFFTNDEIEKTEIESVKSTWNKIIDPGIIEGYKKKVSIKLLQNELLKNFSKKINTYKLFSGKITFCNGFILRNIPFKVICILGMNEEFIIQKTFSKYFNLIHKYPRICDPHRNGQYEYLFLETLLSAKKILLISYNTQSKKNNRTNAPSIIVNQLFSYIKKNFYISKENCKNSNNENKLFSHLYHYHTHESYNIKNFISGSNYQSFNKIWLNCLKSKKTYKKNSQRALKKIEYKNINSSDLISFWKYPIRYFFNKRLHIKLNPIKTVNLCQENFKVTKLNRYIINQNIINFLLNQKNINQLFLYYQYKGIIPYGNLGKIFWKNQVCLVKPLYKKINLIKNKIKNKTFYMKINKYVLHGLLKNINTEGLLYWKSATINNKDMISLWIKHLIYCSIYKPQNSTMLGLKNNNLTFLKLEKKKQIIFYINILMDMKKV